MSKYVQIVFSSSYWDTGTLDGDGNPVYGFIQLADLASYCGSNLIDGNVLQLWGSVYSASGLTQPMMVQLLTNDLPSLKTAISGYLASINAPVSVVALYIFDVDVTVSP